MGYAGGIVTPVVTSDEIRQVYETLRAALQQVEPERPYRGPKLFQQDVLVYKNESQDDIECFWGVETITNNGNLVYQLRYSGGLVR
jgi:hypothetical protein